MTKTTEARYIRRAERATKDGTLGPMTVKVGDWRVYWSDGTMEAMTHAEFVALPEAEIDADYKPSSMMERLRSALESANSLCRSAYAIAQRRGEKTNWDTFAARLKESLDLQHVAMYPVCDCPKPIPNSKGSCDFCGNKIRKENQ